MPDEKTHGDALRMYLTGADSDGGAQTDHDASLGKNRSSTEVPHLGISGSVQYLTIDFVSGNNGEGIGVLTVSGVSEIKWTAPGGTLGAAVAIANGETKIIEDGTDTDKYARITRTSATALGVAATNITLANEVNNAIGLDDVSSAEAAAGDTEYRCVCLKNEGANAITVLKAWLTTLGTQRVSATAQLGASGAGTIEIAAGTFDDWPAKGYCRIQESDTTEREIVYYSSRTSTVLTVPAAGRELLGTTAAAGANDDTVDAVPGIRIAKEAPASQPTGAFTDKTGAGEGSQPAGLTWKSGITAAAGVDVGTLAAGYIQGIWIEREVPAGAVALADIEQCFQWSYDTTP